MDKLLDIIQAQFPVLIHYRYFLLFLGAAIEGMNTIVLSGFLVSINKVSFLPIFLLSILGVTINGYIWYVVGYYAGAKPLDRWGRKDPKGRKIIEKVEEYFNRYSDRAILLTKLTWSLTVATLIMAGSFKYNLKKFTWYNFLGSAGWAAILFFVGYFFGESYKIFLTYLRNFFYLLIFLGAAVALIYTIKMAFRSAFIKSLFLSEKIKKLSDRLKDGIDKFLSE